MRRKAHLAQVNIGRLRAPLDSPQIAGFVARLDEINALAERTPGFVWRLQDDSGNATYVRPYENDLILINMSVWTDVESLKAYVYGSAHREVLRQRAEWFERFDGVYVALWWVPKGHLPSVGEAKARLDHLSRHGPTPFAFTFKQPFPPDAGPVESASGSALAPCT